MRKTFFFFFYFENHKGFGDVIRKLSQASHVISNLFFKQTFVYKITGGWTGTPIWRILFALVKNNGFKYFMFRFSTESSQLVTDMFYYKKKLKQKWSLSLKEYFKFKLGRGRHFFALVKKSNCSGETVYLFRRGSWLENRVNNAVTLITIEGTGYRDPWK